MTEPFLWTCPHFNRVTYRWSKLKITHQLQYPYWRQKKEGQRKEERTDGRTEGRKEGRKKGRKLPCNNQCDWQELHNNKLREINLEWRVNSLPFLRCWIFSIFGLWKVKIELYFLEQGHLCPKWVNETSFGVAWPDTNTLMIALQYTFVIHEI